jgi:hypothetical protein
MPPALDPLLALDDAMIDRLRDALASTVSDPAPIMNALREASDLGTELHALHGTVRSLNDRIAEVEIERREQVATLELQLHDRRAENVALTAKLRAIERGGDMANIFAMYERDVQRLEAELAGATAAASATATATATTTATATAVGGQANALPSSSMTLSSTRTTAMMAANAATSSSAAAALREENGRLRAQLAEATREARQSAVLQQHLDDACAKLGAAARRASAKDEALVAHRRAAELAESAGEDARVELESLRRLHQAACDSLRALIPDSRSLRAFSVHQGKEGRVMARRLRQCVARLHAARERAAAEVRESC